LPLFNQAFFPEMTVVERTGHVRGVTALERIVFPGLSLSPCYRPIVGNVKRSGTYRHDYLWYGMINLGNCHAEAQRATAKFKIY